jgi:hypothetical protein
MAPKAISDQLQAAEGYITLLMLFILLFFFRRFFPILHVPFSMLKKRNLVSL